MAVVFFRSVREAGRKDYSFEQTLAWAPEVPDAVEFARRAADGRITIVAESAGGALVGYVDLEEDGHIDHLYVSAEWVGLGVGSLLYSSLEIEAVALGLRVLRVEASEAARRMFERHGFAVTKRNDLVRGGVRIHNFDMLKTLRTS